MKTLLVNEKDIKRKYYLVDAEGKVLGRLATEVALLLSGKRKVDYTPHDRIGNCPIVE